MSNLTKAVVALLCMTALNFSHGAEPGYRKGQATILEVQMLPQFCWWEYNEGFAATRAELGNCGVGTNHYCPAYLDYLRAQNTFDRRKKLQHLGVAMKEVEYTLKWVYDRQDCPVRNHALATYRSIRLMYSTLGVQLPAPKYTGP